MNQGQPIGRQIFVNHHLAPYFKFIFLNALRLKIKKGVNVDKRVYKYVWADDKGNTLLRKTDGGPTTRVSSIEDLRNLGLELDEAKIAEL